MGKLLLSPGLIIRMEKAKWRHGASSCAEESQPLGADSCLASTVPKIQLMSALAHHPGSLETYKHSYQ